MTENGLPDAALALQSKAEAAGMRTRLDSGTEGCVVRIQDNENRRGFSASYRMGKARRCYVWWLDHPGVERLPFAELSRMLTLCRRLREAQTRLEVAP